MPKQISASVAETVAAIAMHFGASKKLYPALSSRIVTGGNGHLELYQIAIEAAEALEKLGKQKDISWGNDADWILTIEAYADKILDAMVADTFSYSSLKDIASDSIKWE